MDILDYIQTGSKPAVICGSEVLTYDDLHHPTPQAISFSPSLFRGKATGRRALRGNGLGRGSFTLYTTGTTGQSKGVVISKDAVIANSENLIEAQGFHKDLVFIIAGDMTHLGCWSKIFPVLFTGGTLLILKDGMKSLSDFFEALRLPLADYGLSPETKFATFLVPANIRMLLQFGEQTLRELADHIEFIETGGAPMTQSDMERLCEVLPHTRLYNTYASTEAGIICTHDYNRPGQCQAGLVGRPMRHSNVFITAEGKIACQGKTLMTGYENDQELTETVLKYPLSLVEGRGEATLFTSDNGFIDSEGRLHILGRDDDTINVGGYKINPEEVENVAMSHPSVEDCICIGVPHKLLGWQLELQVLLRPGYELDKRQLARHIASRLERYKVPLLYSQVNQIERNKNGKLIRKLKANG